MTACFGSKTCLADVGSGGPRLDSIGDILIVLAEAKRRAMWRQSVSAKPGNQVVWDMHVNHGS